MSFFVYILECRDGSYYTGFTNDLDRRIYDHQIGRFPKAYTFKRRPVKLKFYIDFEDCESAMDFEKQVKGWRREKKLALIEGRWDDLPELSENYSQKIKIITNLKHGK